MCWTSPPAEVATAQSTADNEEIRLLQFCFLAKCLRELYDAAKFVQLRKTRAACATTSS